MKPETYMIPLIESGVLFPNGDVNEEFVAHLAEEDAAILRDYAKESVENCGSLMFSLFLCRFKKYINAYEEVKSFLSEADISHITGFYLVGADIFAIYSYMKHFGKYMEYLYIGNDNP